MLEGHPKWTNKQVVTAITVDGWMLLAESVDTECDGKFSAPVVPLWTASKRASLD